VKTEHRIRQRQRRQPCEDEGTDSKSDVPVLPLQFSLAIMEHVTIDRGRQRVHHNSYGCVGGGGDFSADTSSQRKD